MLLDLEFINQTIIKMEDLIITVVIGAVAGWLAGVIYKGGSLGILGNIVVGIIGGFVGSYIFGLVGVSLGAGLIGGILTSTVGAIILLFLLNLILPGGKRKRRRR
jgi:uncharacterized membrane protein YeaQ/YmgE (transglycosylase-associated protein family)